MFACALPNNAPGRPCPIGSDASEGAGGGFGFGAAAGAPAGGAPRPGPAGACAIRIAEPQTAARAISRALTMSPPKSTMPVAGCRALYTVNACRIPAEKLLNFAIL